MRKYQKNTIRHHVICLLKNDHIKDQRWNLYLQLLVKSQSSLRKSYYITRRKKYEKACSTYNQAKYFALLRYDAIRSSWFKMKLYLFHDVEDALALRKAFWTLHSVFFFYVFDHMQCFDEKNRALRASRKSICARTGSRFKCAIFLVKSHQ